MENYSYFLNKEKSNFNLIRLICAVLIIYLNMLDYFLERDTWKYITKNISFRIWGNNDIGLPGVFTDNKYPISANAPLWAISAECFSYIMIFALFAVSSFNKKNCHLSEEGDILC